VIDPTGGAATAGAGNPTIVYDGGVARTLIPTANFPAALNNSRATLIAAAAGLTSKILSLHIICTAFTTAGLLVLQDGAGAVNHAVLAQVTALGQTWDCHADGYVFAQGALSGAITIFYTGNATFALQAVYYQAP
jgi:hypothetical protein